MCWSHQLCFVLVLRMTACSEFWGLWFAVFFFAVFFEPALKEGRVAVFLRVPARRGPREAHVRRARPHSMSGTPAHVHTWPIVGFAHACPLQLRVCGLPTR